MHEKQTRGRPTTRGLIRTFLPLSTQKLVYKTFFFLFSLWAVSSPPLLEWCLVTGDMQDVFKAQLKNKMFKNYNLAGMLQFWSLLFVLSFKSLNIHPDWLPGHPPSCARSWVSRTQWQLPTIRRGPLATWRRSWGRNSPQTTGAAAATWRRRPIERSVSH